MCLKFEASYISIQPIKFYSISIFYLQKNTYVCLSFKICIAPIKLFQKCPRKSGENPLCLEGKNKGSAAYEMMQVTSQVNVLALKMIETQKCPLLLVKLCSCE